MGTSRDSLYRIKELYNTGGEEALREISRRKPIPKNRVEPEVEQAVVKMAFDYPVYGQSRAQPSLLKSLYNIASFKDSGFLLASQQTYSDSLHF